MVDGDIPTVLLHAHHAFDLATKTSIAGFEQDLGALLALEANDLAVFFEEGWSVDELLESLRPVLQGVQAMPKITRRKVLELGAAAVLSTIAVPSGRHVSAEERVNLQDALGESIAASWKLFHTASNAQVLAVGQAQLHLLQQSHALLHPRNRSLFYSSVYNLIGMAMNLQGRNEDALQAHESAYIAALQMGETRYVVESLLCQVNAYYGLGQHIRAIETIEEALRILGNSSQEGLIRSKAHLLGCWAASAMTMGEYTTASKKLEESAALVHGIGANEEFDYASYLQLAGNCALAIGDHETAIRYYTEALSELPPNWLIRRAFALLPLMVAYACARDLDASLDMADKAACVVDTLNAPIINKQFTSSVKPGLIGAFPKDTRVHQFVVERTAHLL